LAKPFDMQRSLLSLFWIVLLWWTAYALVFAGQVVSMGEQQGQAITWGQALRHSFGGWMTWVPLSLGLCWLVLRYPIGRGHLWRPLSILFLGVLAVVVLRAAYVAVTNPLFGWYETLPSFGEVLMASLRNNIMLAATVVGVAHALVFYRQAREREQRVAELETHLATTQLEALRAQLHPHFLFNALNSVAEMLHRDPEVADHMLVSLSALLRDSLAVERNQLRPLRRELAVIEHYLMIEKIRLGDRLAISWQVDEPCLDIDVPMLILQPLVENAIVHAIARQRAPGTLVVRARIDDDMLVLDVENSVGPGQPSAPGTGMGLRSIRDRLRLLYAERATLVTVDAGAGVHAAQVRLPIEPSGTDTMALAPVERA
jgi:hypothetical protein